MTNVLTAYIPQETFVVIDNHGFIQAVLISGRRHKSLDFLISFQTQS